MTKVLFKYFLFSFLLFLSSFNFLRAYTNQNCTYTYYGKPFEISSFSCFADMQNNLESLNKDVSSGSEKGNDDLSALFAYDDDDDESFSFKKHLENGNYVTFASPTQANECFFNYSNKNLSPCMHISYTLPFRYLIFQVIRI